MITRYNKIHCPPTFRDFKNNTFKVCTIIEYVTDDIRYIVVDCYALKTCAIPECTAADSGNTFAYFYACKVCAKLEYRMTDRSNAIRDCYAFKVFAIAKLNTTISSTICFYLSLPLFFLFSFTCFS